MSDVNMPVTEASEREKYAYELAYHVLPTVAEGEVVAVTTELKNLVSQHQGMVFDEEVAERFELAYEIEKYLEGRYRRFSSAYFGWLRFNIEPSELPALTDEIDAHKSLLRNLVIRLTKQEEQNPFRFHEAIADIKQRNVIPSDDETIESENDIETVDGDVEPVIEVADTEVKPVVE